MFYFHILDLNVNEWIPIKGYIEVVPSNSQSTSSCDIVVYWEYGQMDLVWSLLRLLRPWIGYGYTGCMLGRAPRTKETLLNFFVKIWISINRTQQCGIGSLEIHRNFAG